MGGRRRWRWHATSAELDKPETQRSRRQPDIRTPVHIQPSPPPPPPMYRHLLLFQRDNLFFECRTWKTQSWAACMGGEIGGDRLSTKGCYANIAHAFVCHWILTESSIGWYGDWVYTYACVSQRALSMNLSSSPSCPSVVWGWANFCLSSAYEIEWFKICGHTQGPLIYPHTIYT